MRLSATPMGEHQIRAVADAFARKPYLRHPLLYACAAWENARFNDAEAAGPPALTVALTAAELELLTWRLCQPHFDEIGARYDRHDTGVDADTAGMALYQRLMGAWDEWAR